MAPDDRVSAVVEALRDARKYRHLCDEILTWAAVHALERQPTERAALKFAKRKLHQAFGSFVGDRKRLLGALEEAARATSDEGFRIALAGALGQHASTAERGSEPGALWAVIRDAVGDAPSSVLDLGCGAHPATLPWSGLDGSVVYRGVDLDDELGRALGQALRPRYPNVDLSTGDVRSATEWPHFDVALLAKLLPTLERQEAGAAGRLVDKLDVGFVVATFPTRSLGGRDHGMETAYRGLATRVLGPGSVHIEEHIVGDELVVVSRRTV